MHSAPNRPGPTASNPGSHAAIFGLLVVAAAFLLLPGPSTAFPAQPRLQTPQALADGFRFRVAGEPSTPYRLESSSDLVHWVPWLMTNSTLADFTVEDHATGGAPFRFYRAQTTPAAPTPLRFVSPAAGARLATDRPVIDLAAPGVDFALTPPSLRANGEVVGCRFEIRESGLRCTPTNALPSGFVQLTASLPGAGAGLPPFDRLEVLVLPDDRNLPPQARPDAIFATAGSPATVRPLANDRDPNGEALRLSGVGAAAHGEVRFDGSGISYTAAAGYSGSDSFTYTVQDGRGGSATAKVFVTARPAPAVAVFLDDPAGAALQGPRPSGEAVIETSLEVALTNLCARLRPGERGRITVRAKKPIRLNRLRLGCPVDLVTEDGSAPQIQGQPLAIEVPVGGSLVGMVFSSSGPITLLAGGDLAVVNNVFDADVMLQLAAGSSATPPGPALHGPPGSATGLVLQAGEVLLESNQFKNLLGTGDLTDDGRLQLRGGSGLAASLQLNLEDQAGVDAEAAGFTDSYSWRLHLTGRSKFALRDTVGVRRVSGSFEMTGTHESTLENVVTADAEFDLRGVATLNASFRGVRTDRLRLDSYTRNLQVQSENEIHLDAKLRFHTPPGTSADVTWTGRNLKFHTGFMLQSDDDTQLSFESNVLTGHGPFNVDARGKLALRLFGDVQLGGEVAVSSTVGPTRLEVTDFKADAAINATILDGPVDLLIQSGVTHGGTAFALPEGSPVKGLFEHVEQQGGFGCYVGLIARGTIPGSALNGSQPATGKPRMRPATVSPAQAGPGPGLRFHDVTFSGPSRQSSGLFISGLTSPVEVSDCTFTSFMPGGLSLVINEVDAPVTVRGNRFTGGVFTADGDLEGEGRSGRIRRDYVFEDNQVNAPGNLVGLAFQDLSSVVLRRNKVVADRCLQVSAGQVTAENNTFEAGGFAGTAIVVLAGPGGSGALIARGNTVKSGVPLMMGGGAYANFDGGNTFASAGLLPFTALTVGGSDGQPGYARFRGNTFGMVMLTVGPGGIADVTGNSFTQLISLTDANKQGGLVSDPRSNAGVIPDLCSSYVDFDGDGCNDLPPRCAGRDEDGECLCGNGVSPASTPPWPLP